MDVEHGDGERDSRGAESLQQGEVFVGAVPVVAAPPVAEREPGQHRCRPGDRVQRAHGRRIIVAVAEEVQVGPRSVPGGHPAIVVQDQGAGIVETEKPHRECHARFQRHAAVGVVQRAGGAAEVVGDARRIARRCGRC